MRAERIEIDGVTYGVERTGAGPPLVVLHGFAGNAAAMRDITLPLGERFEVLAVDLPGHGAAGVPADLARFGGPSVARDLVALAERCGASRAAWFGYSMGGRYALHVAIADPRAVSTLAVLGASPGILDPAARAARRSADDALADVIVRDGLAAFLDRWEAQPMFAGLHRLDPERQRRLRSWRTSNTAQGLAASLRGFGTGTMTPLQPQLRTIAAPVLALAGAGDERYAGIASALAAAVPDGRSALVAGAGHAAHLEAPAHVVRALTEFLSPQDAS